MADYAISNVPRRVVYAASGTGPYAFTFEVLSATDIAVYKASTLLTLTTDYTVTINANGTGSVTLVTTAGTSNITIVGAKNIQRTTDFTTGGDFFANTLNDELDAQTIFIQQVAETAERGLKAPVTDPTDINMTLPAKDGRKGKVLSFDTTTGDPIASFAAGDISNAQTYATNAAASASAASSSASSASSSASSASSSASSASSSASTATTQATNASTSASGASTSASNASSSASSASTSASNASTSATNASNSASSASTSATNAAASASSASSAQVAAEAARDATLTAYDNFDDRYLGSKTSDPTLDNDGNALVGGSLYFNSVSGTMKIYTGSAWVAAYVSGTDYLAKINNLSDLNNTTTARTNLGLGSIATQASNSVTITGGSISGITDLAVADGGTGASTLTGVLKGNGTSAFTAATAGTDFVAPGTATTFTALQTFAGTSSNADLKTSNILEVATVSATAATGTIAYDTTTQSVLYYTTNASGNFTVNFRGSSGTSLNTIMATGESLSATFLVTNGATAYYNSVVQVDGTTAGVTTQWQGSAPTSGNASSIDVYTYVIIKTASATFTVLASQTKFA